jgi:hypothetical protein
MIHFNDFRKSRVNLTPPLDIRLSFKWCRAHVYMNRLSIWRYQGKRTVRCNRGTSDRHYTFFCWGQWELVHCGQSMQLCNFECHTYTHTHAHTNKQTKNQTNSVKRLKYERFSISKLVNKIMVVWFKTTGGYGRFRRNLMSPLLAQKPWRPLVNFYQNTKTSHFVGKSRILRPCFQSWHD